MICISKLATRPGFLAFEFDLVLDLDARSEYTILTLFGVEVVPRPCGMILV
jgi:hypothetical protein